MIRVVLVDDQSSYARGLQMLFSSLTEDIEVAAICTNSDDAVRVIKAANPDIVILDIRMPRKEGLGLAEEVGQQFPEVKIVMHSVSDSPDDAYEAVRLGVRGYISKLVEVEELFAALRMINAGQVVVSPFVMESLLTAPESVDLKQEEANVLKLLAEGLDNGEIAEAISVSNSTLKRTLQGIMRKLNVQNRPELTAEAARRGFL